MALKISLFMALLHTGFNSWAETQIKAMSIAEVKSKIADAVLLRQRERALDIVNSELDFLSTNPAVAKKDSKKDQLLSLKQNILNQFYSEKIQNLYEDATVSYLENKRKAAKNISDCLESEAKNIQCLWMDLKIARFYEDGSFEQKVLKYIELTKDLPDLKLRATYLQNKYPHLEFEKAPPLENEVKKSFEKKVLELLIKYDQATSEFNPEKAKSVLDELEKMAPDHPDLILLRTKVSGDLTQYANKAAILRGRCQALSADIIRKYIFDIDFCKRG